MGITKFRSETLKQVLTFRVSVLRYGKITESKIVERIELTLSLKVGSHVHNRRQGSYKKKLRNYFQNNSMII